MTPGDTAGSVSPSRSRSFLGDSELSSTCSSEVYLLRRIERLRRRVAAAVTTRQVDDPNPDDRFRGLYVTADQALSLLNDRPLLVDETATSDGDRLVLEAWADDRQLEGEEIRLRTVSLAFGLSPIDVEILLVSLAPDIDPRLEQAYGYLHDDVTRRRASVGLALELCGVDPVDPVARGRFSSAAPLFAGGLIRVEESDRPFLTRSLRVPDTVTNFLLGDNQVDPALLPVLGYVQPLADFDSRPLLRALRSGVRLVYIRDRVGAAALSYAASAAEAAGWGTLTLDLNRLAAGQDIEELAIVASRQARLTRSALIVEPLELLVEHRPGGVRAFAECEALVFLIGSRSWDPLWSKSPPLCIDAPEIPKPFIDSLPFRLTPEQATQALDAANQQALADGVETSLEYLAAGARAQNTGALERLALRIRPHARWDDLVAPARLVAQLKELGARVRYRDQVMRDWGLALGSHKGRGVTALFSGPSGTGKTLAAEVMAGELGLDLYVIDLATVVDKYVGETEKNLDRIFREAERVNGILLFDEADSVFGKRSDVQDAHDRYANIEVAYLLQRMERFNGVAILTTNLRSNVDEAFLRRLDVLLDFPSPDESMRLRLWNLHLPEEMPRDRTVDVEFLAHSFDLSGGNIRNVSLAAAFLCASDGRPLSMNCLIRAVAQEYRKLGRLFLESEFGPYHHLASNEG